MEIDQGGTWQSSRMTDICRDSVYDRVGITNQWGKNELFGNQCWVSHIEIKK